MKKQTGSKSGLAKVATGFSGFDTMTGGGLPRGRITVIAGAAGTGKTLFALQAMVNAIKASNGTGILVSFEESPASISLNFAGFDWNLPDLLDSKLLLVDGRWQAETLSSGNFNIAGLLAAVEGAARERGAQHLVLDGIDALLAMLPDATDPRRELVRLQAWAERLGLTTFVTIKAPGTQEQGHLEEIAIYMADCVVVLENPIVDGVSTRSLFIKKYRGSAHFQNKMPYVIGARGIDIEDIGDRSGGFKVFNERVSTGIPDLDEMLRGGFFRGSTTLLSGSPGTSKTTLAAKLMETACAQGEKSLLICFDEAPEEIVRNVASVGVDLQRHIDSGQLLMDGFVARSASADLLANRVLMLLESFRPSHLVLDPVSAFSTAGGEHLAHNAVRLIVQHCKRSGITLVLTSLLEPIAGNIETSKAHVSTLADNWLHLSYMVNGGERNRALTIVKSRGTGHSNQVRELILSDTGIHLESVYTEEGEVLMGAMRWQREERSRQQRRQQKLAEEQHYRTVRLETDELALRISQLQRELQEKQMDLARVRDEDSDTRVQESERRNILMDIRNPETPLKSPANGSKGRSKKALQTSPEQPRKKPRTNSPSKKGGSR